MNNNYHRIMISDKRKQIALQLQLEAISRLKYAKEKLSRDH